MSLIIQRGVFRPRLKDLIQMNTPRVVIQESKKAFRAIFKRNDLEAAMGALSNLKGVGPAMASGRPFQPLSLDEAKLKHNGKGKHVFCENHFGLAGTVFGVLCFAPARADLTKN